jgi:hypothetical protein
MSGAGKPPPALPLPPHQYRYAELKIKNVKLKMPSLHGFCGFLTL